MENWQKDLLEMMEAVANEVESFFLEVGEMVDVFWEITEEISEQVQDTIVTEFDLYLQEFTEQIQEAYSEMGEAITDIDTSFPYAEAATMEKNSACMGCHHYHGKVYGGNLLVCAMHPHGRDDQSCPDWEKEEYPN